MSRVDSIEALELGPIASSSRDLKSELEPEITVQTDSKASSRAQFEAEQISVIDPHGSREQLRADAAAERDNVVQELAPIDGGWPAWRFVAAGFMVEVMIWGFQFWSVLELGL